MLIDQTIVYPNVTYIMTTLFQENAKEKAFSQVKQQCMCETSWFIFYTSPRAEKVVCQELQKMNYEVFLPMVKTPRVWKNRQKKWVDQVLFPGYIFVNTQERELYTINRVNKVATYIHFAGKPSVVPMTEIEGIRKMLSLDQEVSVEASFKEGENVKIIDGPLVGHIGILVKQKGKTRFGIQLKEINQTVFIDVCSSMLERM